MGIVSYSGMQKSEVRSQKVEIVATTLLLHSYFCPLTFPLQCFANNEHDQDRQLRLNWVPVSGMWIDKVVNRRIHQHQSRKEPCARYLFANGAAQPPQGQHRRRQKRRGSKIKWRAAA